MSDAAPQPVSANAPTAAIIGAGPAGLMAAERLARAGARVTVYERMPTPARKFLLAGRGGLNLTHSEPREAFLARYGEASPWLQTAIDAFSPDDLRAWAADLGEPTFIGSSGRVFPESFKASPLLRAWLRRLDGLGVRLATRHHWLGWADDGQLRFSTPDGESLVRADATVLALGGASWPRLGADGGWVDALTGAGVNITPLAPANCGVLAPWSEHLSSRFAGEPLKRIAMSCDDSMARGEAVLTTGGLEGGVVYALSRPIRAALQRDGAARLFINLRPDLSPQELIERLARPRGRQSQANWLRKAAGIAPVAVALLREIDIAEGVDSFNAGPAALAARITHLPIVVTGLAGMERAISSSGGVARTELDAHMMLTRRPGVFVAGEMLDWDAPTGGYLLQASFATGAAAAQGAAAWLAEHARSAP